MSQAITAEAVKEIIGNAKVILKKRQLPSQDAFTLSAVVGALLNVPKDYVLDEMLKKDS